ncbi:MAG: NADH-quinone oxidoreductase subunit C [Candidatus Heimdallarchaeaceae archaeon]
MGAENAKYQQLQDRLKGELQTDVVASSPRRLWATIRPDKLIESCTKAYDLGFKHLSTISVVDWLEEGKFELAYHLWSYEHKLLLTLKTKIDREKPSIDSVCTFWGANAEVCERECHEFFGVEFIGNNNLKPLMLEGWNGPPPFRKDFNWREYVRVNHYRTDDPREEVYFEGGT